jgi:Predicted RNA-binding protein homologous to eukaryotic snRNP
MPQDLITIKCLAAELDYALKGSRVTKITQPESDELRFELKKNGNKLTLVVSANPAAPRLHLATDKKDNPYNAPAFCMHLRKYLTGAEVTSVAAANDDRIFKISFAARDELNFNRDYMLFFEQMSRYSNIILTTADGIVSDCLHRVNFDVEAERVLVPTAAYVFPKKADKAEAYDCSAVKSRLLATTESTPFNALIKNVNGLSKATANELILKSGLTVPVTEAGADKLIDALAPFNEGIKSELFNPCVSADFSDYFLFPYDCIRTDYIFCDTLNEAAERYYEKSDKISRIKRKAKDIIALVKRHRDRLVKKLGFANEKLAECENMESEKLKGELLTANLFRLKKGDASVTLQNYYDDYKPIDIPLDVKKTPQQNAAAYYTKYAKLKRAKVFAEEQVSEYDAELKYVNSILEELDRADLQDIPDIRQELMNLGILKKQALKKGEKRPLPSRPKEYAIGDYSVFVGTNNILNNLVTFDIGRSFDLWLHVKTEHGAHVIIRKNNESDIIPDEVIASAARIAAFYSSAKNSENVAVDYTERRNVRRIKGAGAGMVSYINYQTVFVNPDALDELLKKS